jgi:hypothetical protein
MKMFKSCQPDGAILTAQESYNVAAKSSAVPGFEILNHAALRPTGSSVTCCKRVANNPTNRQPTEKNKHENYINNSGSFSRSA